MAKCDRARTWEWKSLPRSVPVPSYVLPPERQDGQAECCLPKTLVGCSEPPLPASVNPAI